MAKKKIDPQVQRMMESFNRKPTAAEEADFYKRNAGGPMAMTSLTRGRGYLGNFGEPDRHIAARYRGGANLDEPVRSLELAAGNVASF